MTILKKYQNYCRKYCFIQENAIFRCTYVTLILLILPQFLAAQTAKKSIKLDFTNAPIEQVIKSIESQTSYTFFYNSDIDVKKTTTVQLKSNDIHQIMSAILKKSPIDFRVSGERIVLYLKKETSDHSQKHTIAGIIKDESGPIIGASISTQQNKGTITNMNGEFRLDNIQVGETLTISYIGYETAHLVYKGEQSLNIVLKEAAQELEQVVVTALGIKRESKSLTYNVQELKNDDLTAIKDASFVNSLAGKIAGLTINQSASGIGGSTRVVMRGLKSISNDNNALYVIDGIPMSSMRSNQDANLYENPDGGDSDGISSINADDIESMSVLTGAAAAALYGTQGANGVILITTRKGKEGKLKINYSNDSQFLSPFVMPEFQNRYGSPEGEFSSWGAKKQTSWEPKDFFQTGYNETNSIGLSSGNDRNQTYFSAASTNARGIIPNNTYNRYNFTLRNTTELVKDKLVLDLNGSYIISNNNNMMSQGQYHNPLVPLYLFPRGDNMDKYKVYERYDSEKYYDIQYWPYRNQGMGMENPYWIVNRQNMSNHKSRYMFTANLNYKINNWLNLVGRMRVDNSFDTYERKISASSDLLYASEYGNYMNLKTSYKNTYGDAMAQINKRWENWSINANIGGSFNQQYSESTGYEGHLVTIPNHFSFNNIQQNDANTKAIQKGENPYNNQAVFATFQVGYKSYAYLDLTGRNDWYSSLANTNYEKSGFFFKSIGLSTVISEMIDLTSAHISFLKVRASYSEVGNPPQQYISSRTYPLENGKLSTSARLINPKLKPELTKAYELGTNLRMFGNLLNIDLTYYNSNTYNQYFTYTMPPSTGYKEFVLNGGKVNNWGIEARLGINTHVGPVKWNSNFTFTLNRNKVKYLLPGGAINPVNGEPINITEIEPFSAQGNYKMIIKEGGTLSDIYVTGLKTDYQGNIKVNPQTGAIEADPNNWIKAGSVAPRYNWAIGNSFSWNGLSLSFLIDARIGGVGVSATQAKMDYYGTSKSSADARDQGGKIINGGKINAQDYYSIVGNGLTGALAQYVYSMTNVRLREASLSYTIPNKWLKNQVQNLTVSLIGKNLYMFYKKAPFDPELTASTGTYYQGFDYFMQPSMRSIGFSVKFQY